MTASIDVVRWDSGVGQPVGTSPFLRATIDWVFFKEAFFCFDVVNLHHTVRL